MPVTSAFDISGKVIWVTGSSRGIGRGIAEHLAEIGVSVVVHGRSEEAIGPVVAALQEGGAPVLGVVADVREPSGLATAAEAIRNRFGRLDALVANVGGAAFGPADTLAVDRFRRQLDLNLTGAFASAQAAYPLLRDARGAIVFIAATAVGNPTPQFAAYGAAKAAIAHLTGSLAAEWGPAVRVNCVSPGLVRTEGSLQAVFRGEEELVIKAGRTTAVGRIGEPRDIALACQYLVSDAAAFVSGATLVCDGGPTEGPTQRILRALES
jgi:3-oxoacyl-[acyl-carrier protein] reductase